MAESAIAFHAKVVEAANQFALNTVLCGLELLKLKHAIGHGKWEEFCQQNFTGKGLSDSHRRRYTEIATAWKVKSSRIRGGQALQLQAATLENADAIKDVLSEFTQATTWHQLWIDFGLMRKPKSKGGARVAGEKTPVPEDLLLQHARQWWNGTLCSIEESELTGKDPRWAHLPPLERRGVVEGLRAIAEHIAKSLR